MARRARFGFVPVALVLSLASLAALLVLPDARNLDTTKSPLDDATISLPELGRRALPAEVEAEMVTSEQGRPEWILYSPTTTEASDEVSIELAEGETITLDRRELELGTRIPGRVPVTDPPPADSAGDRESESESKRLKPRILSVDRALKVRLRASDVPSPGPRVDPVPPPRRAPLVFTLEPGVFRLAQAGGLEIPIYVVARRRAAGGRLSATTAGSDIDLLVEAPGVEAQRLTIEKGRPRSTQAAYLPLRRAEPLRVTASRLGGDAEPATLDISWQAFGPDSLNLRVRPARGESYATGLSPLSLSVHLESDGQRLSPGHELPILVEAPTGLRLEPAETVLPADGRPARIEVRAAQGLQQTLVIAAPDLGLETSVPVRFRPPWKFLAIAGLLGLLGVVVARRKQLLEQKKAGLVLELVTAAAGGLLLYTAFLIQWLPSPGFLLGELPAGAVGVLGGYLGEGVFQLLTRRLNLDRPGDEDTDTA